MEFPAKVSRSGFQLAAFYHRGAACAQSSDQKGELRDIKSELALTYPYDLCGTTDHHPGVLRGLGVPVADGIHLVGLWNLRSRTVGSELGLFCPILGRSFVFSIT
jgi:hypothetical protein